MLNSVLSIKKIVIFIGEKETKEDERGCNTYEWVKDCILLDMQCRLNEYNQEKKN